MELTLIITGLLATVAGLVVLAAAAVAGLAAGSGTLTLIFKEALGLPVQKFPGRHAHRKAARAPDPHSTIEKKWIPHLGPAVRRSWLRQPPGGPGRARR